jgi:DNA-binding response OmpR family regulator
VSKRILIVEDDAALAKVLSDRLTLDGFDVAWSPDGHDAPSRARAFRPDLILLDIMLPGASGFELCQLLRQGGRTPDIILSVRGQKHDKIRGFNVGADDYVTKPFEPEELVARIHAVLRRFSRPVHKIKMGEVSIDFETERVEDPSGNLHLTHQEFEILRLLAAHEGQVVYRDELLRQVWGVLFDSTKRTVDYAIARLRKKIEADPHHPRFIRSVRGDGYRLTLKRADNET